jgi:hypothetical protein
MFWRASTGRHDLSQRQLVLLREMLNNNGASDNEGGLSPQFPIPAFNDVSISVTLLSICESGLEMRGIARLHFQMIRRAGLEQKVGKERRRR